jgi:predicted Zn-dependent protease with MMP-like domain
MAEAINPKRFEEIVDWAHSTLPQKIRDLPDFPGIQVADEPPEEVLRKKKLPPGRELLGLYSGIYRTERLHNQIRIAPDLIFVFSGPIQRCSRGDLRAEVKEVVWHEVAHWLGHDEEEVKALGLATLSQPAEDIAHRQVESNVSEVDAETRRTAVQQRFPPDNSAEASETTEEQPRCIRCYSTNLTCRELCRPVAYTSFYVRAKIWVCKSCGREWDDEDDE